PRAEPLEIIISNIRASQLELNCNKLKNISRNETEIHAELSLTDTGTVKIETAYSPRPGERLNFIAFSDTHLGDPEAEEHFTRVLKHTNMRDPLFAVNAGDIVDVDEPAQWKIFEERAAALKVPLFTTIGNHDSYLSSKLYRKHLGDLFYYFKFFDAQFLFLDNAQKYNRASLYMDGSDPEAQWNWLTARIKEPAKHRIVFFHFPVFGNRSMMDPMYMQSTPLEKRKAEVEQMIQLFRESGVEYICFGHIHSPDRQLMDGIVHLRLGGGGGSKASNTDDRDVNLVHFFIDESGIRDYTVFLYFNPAEVERIEFCEPRGRLPAGAREPLVVHGVAKNRLLGIEPEFKIISGPGKIDGNAFIADSAGRTVIEARHNSHKSRIELEVF
ncbi:MAG: metallophosphoesterase, partial [bacterium]